MAKPDETQPQKHLDLILAASGDGVYGLDREGRTTFSNPAAQRLTGFSSEDMLGKGSHVLVHHSHADGTHYDKLDCPIYAAFKDGKVHHVSDEVFWRKDGSNFPVEYVSTPIFDDGELVGAVVSFRDITERKNTEAALQESEERYRKIVEATHDVIFLVRAEDGAIQDANEAASLMLGYTRVELLTKTVMDLHPHETEALMEFMATVRETGSGKTDKLSCFSNADELIPVRLSASIMQLQGDECVLVMAQDQREYIEAEAQARKLQSDLHHVGRLSAMGEMASGLAHELNQPLTAVMNYVQASHKILDSGNDEQRGNVSEYMTKAVEQADRAGKIISGLRKFVEKDDSAHSLEDINQIVEEASRLVLLAVVAADTELSTKLQEDIPPILVDKIQIQQVVFNLVRNAVEALQFSKAGVIKVVTFQTQDAVQISVSDNGPGVEVALVDSLFDQFVTTKPDGMGVGLSICKSIVEGHGGMITAKSNPEGGMSFIFTLPLLSDEGGEHE
ncbi:MAG: PAS domain S-box protein [Hyphomonadaceae bacterium]